MPAFTWQPRLAAPAQKAALANIHMGIKDPELRAKVTPNFRIGCKRILRSNTYYPALAADNVDVVTEPIARVTPTSIVTADGHEHPVDVIVVATGFWTTEPADRRAHHRPRRPQPRRRLGRRRHGGVQGDDRPRLPQPLPAGRPQHRPGPHQHGVHHRVAGGLPARRGRHPAQPSVRRRGAARGRPAALERRPAATDEADRLEHRRLLVVVPRRRGPQHHAVAAHDVHLPPSARSLRPRGVRRLPAGGGARRTAEGVGA